LTFKFPPSIVLDPIANTACRRKVAMPLTGLNE
jgi:hypothetical protein